MQSPCPRILSSFKTFWLLCAALLVLAYAQTAAATPGSQPSRILVLGDSLSAEYGLERGSGWVDLLQRRLATEGLDYDVINASISGETTSGGIVRLPALLEEYRPAVVVLELGANDALRGLQPRMSEANLREMARLSQAAGADVVIVGMHIPPNYGRTYAERFHAMFATVATDEKAALVPFLLEGMATDLGLFQADRIHPNELAQPLLLNNVWPVLLPLL